MGIEKCLHFLKINGWDTDYDGVDDEYIPLHKKDNISIDINTKEIVFIGDSGDFLHIPTNYYALIGALLQFKAIAMDYKT